MTTDRVRAIEALLTETEEAHGAYERAELDGVYDQEWPAWYARYAIDHGIGELVGHPVSSDELAQFLTTTWERAQQADPKPADPWSAYMARQIAAAL
jgi:hypothetical protein